MAKGFQEARACFEFLGFYAWSLFGSSAEGGGMF